MKGFFVFLILFISVFTFGQKPTTVIVDITVKSMATNKSESGVTVSIYQGTKVVASSVTTRNGKVNLNVPSGEVYKIELKKAGLVTRYFNADTKGIDLELIQDNETPFVLAEVSLFEEVGGVDFSYVKNNPFTVFKFDGKSSNLTFDKSMSDKMSVKIKELLEAAKRQEQNNEVQYQAKMKQGEELATQKKYKDAIDKFEQALMFKPADKVAIKRIDDMEKLMTAEQVDIVSGQAADAEFTALVKAADGLRDAKKYRDAIDKYEEALTKKRGDGYCIDEIEKLEKIIKAEKEAKENEEKYKAAMAVGIQMMGQKSYETALNKFNEALQAKPNDPTATAKKAEAQKQMDAQKDLMAKKLNYEKLVAEADQMYNEEVWDVAKAKYQEALTIESASTYVQGRLKDVEAKIKAQLEEKQKQEQIAKLLANANTLFSESKWQESKAKYLEVQALDAKNETAKSQLEIIEQKLLDEKKNAELNKQFADLVTKGDNAFTAKKFQDALTSYNQALELKQDLEVQEKVSKTQLEIEKLANAAKTKEMYEAAIKEADQLFANQDYVNAKQKYTNALTLDDTQKYPKDQIAKIDKLVEDLKAKQEKEEAFNELISQAQDFFNAEKYLDAKDRYVKAKEINPTSPIPDQKIKEIDKILADEKAKQEADAQLVALLKTADEAFSAEKYNEAKKAYQNVLTKDAKNERAIAQIKVIEEIEQYQTAFNKGLEQQGKEQYQEAILSYQKAKEISPSRTEPDQKIAEINKILGDLADSKKKQEEEEAKKKELALQISNLIAEGDALVSSEQYKDAITKFNDAKKLDETNKEIQPKIDNAQKLLDEQLKNQSKEEQYQALFKAGKESMLAQKYDEAINSFKQALAVDPTKKEAEDKIKEAEDLKKQLMAQKSAEELAQKYGAFIEDGEAFIKAEKYQDAIASFQKASNLMPEETYPKKKIEEINDLIELQKQKQANQKRDEEYLALFNKGEQQFKQKNYQDALTAYQSAAVINNTDEVKNKIELTKGKISELEGKELDKQYKDLMTSAAGKEKANDLEGAIDDYKKASRVKEQEEAPKQKIQELTDKLKAQQAQAEVDKNYQAAMQEADDAFNKEDYTKAIEKYNLALTFKDEKRPKEQILLAQKKAEEVSRKDEDIQFEKMLKFAQQKIDERDYAKALDLVERAEDNRPNEPRLIKLKKEIQSMMKLEELYKEKIAEADEKLNQEAYKDALKLYETAQKMMPTETYPSQKIAEINEIFSSQKDFKQKSKEYAALLKKATAEKNKNQLENALNIANQAKNLLPQEKEAKELIENIEKLLLAVNKANNKSSLDSKFNDVLAGADQLFKNKSWSKAKTEYNKALTIKPDDEYIKEQIEKCNASLADAELNRSKYLAVLATADQDFKMTNYEKAKEGYNLALTYDGTQQYPKDQIAAINNLLSNRNKVKGEGLDKIGDEQIDITLLEGAALLARAEEERKLSKGQLIKDKRNLAIERSDSMGVISKDYVAAANDSLALTKELNVQDLTDYYNNQFDKDKQVKELNDGHTDWMNQQDAYTYTDRLEGSRKMGVVNEMVIEQHKTYVQHNDGLVDSMRYVGKEISDIYTENTFSDYDQIMMAKQNLRKEDDTKVEKDKIQEKSHDILKDEVKNIREDAIDKDNLAYNEVYTKQMKAKIKIKDVETQEHNDNLAYHENKSLDIDKSNKRLKDARFKYDSDEMNDDELREGARLSLKGELNNQVDKNFTEQKKSNIKVDDVKNIAKKEETLQLAQNSDKKESIYDTRSDIKNGAYPEVKFPAKVANSVGKNYPEGVTQESFKENGPDGLPKAIITRRIVVKNGYGDVYTRTQKYGSITYSKNGEVCTEMIWRNETTDPSLEKHY